MIVYYRGKGRRHTCPRCWRASVKMMDCKIDPTHQGWHAYTPPKVVLIP